MRSWKNQADDFLKNETQFRLGFLSSEARNPRTMNLDKDFQESTAKGVRTLLSCDRALTPVLHRTLAGRQYAAMVEAMRDAERIVFSGCGASGRLAILLETAWNEAFPNAVGRVLSLMTGGDFALVKSVENFEDSAEVGQCQVREFALGPSDVLVGITATGETASVLGSAAEAARRGARVFMLVCVSADTIYSSPLERCRELYALPNVTVIAMPIGAMALTGSTRMQSSTIELTVAAAALETAAAGGLGDYAGAFDAMLDGLESDDTVSGIADWIDWESGIYQTGGLIDYVSDDFAVDIISDTTERSPTFFLPPYKFLGDNAAPEPWAMLRGFSELSSEVWRKILKREIRCIQWSGEEYQALGLGYLVANGVPEITAADLYRIPIGGEPQPSRDGAARLEFDFNGTAPLVVNGRRLGETVADSPMRLFEHLRIKLLMNTVSTGTMVKLGRVRSNYMIHLGISNKKLIDRACRIISELCGVSYEDACRELFRNRAEAEANGVSPVAETIRRIEMQKPRESTTTTMGKC